MPRPFKKPDTRRKTGGQSSAKSSSKSSYKGAQAKKAPTRAQLQSRASIDAANIEPKISPRQENRLKARAENEQHIFPRDNSPLARAKAAAELAARNARNSIVEGEETQNSSAQIDDNNDENAASSFVNSTENEGDDSEIEYSNLAEIDANSDEDDAEEDDSDDEITDANSERLHKLIARAGVASRRAAEEIISQGRVLVNGIVVIEAGAKANPFRDRISVDGQPLRVPTGPATVILMNKPSGVVSTRKDPEGRTTVTHLLPEKYKHLHPIGRLDYDTSGLLFLTDDGSLTQLLTHPSHGVEKVYWARVRGTVTVETVKRLENGIYLDDGKTATAKVRVRAQTENNALVQITLREGRNRQVRRMLDFVGHPVRALRRIRVGGFGVDELLPGQYRVLLPGEVHMLRKAAETKVKSRPKEAAPRSFASDRNASANRNAPESRGVFAKNTAFGANSRPAFSSNSRPASGQNPRFPARDNRDDSSRERGNFGRAESGFNRGDAGRERGNDNRGDFGRERGNNFGNAPRPVFGAPRNDSREGGFSRNDAPNRDSQSRAPQSSTRSASNPFARNTSAPREFQNRDSSNRETSNRDFTNRAPQNRETPNRGFENRERANSRDDFRTSPNSDTRSSAPARSFAPRDSAPRSSGFRENSSRDSSNSRSDAPRSFPPRANNFSAANSRSSRNEYSTRDAKPPIGERFSDSARVAREERKQHNVRAEQQQRQNQMPRQAESHPLARRVEQNFVGDRTQNRASQSRPNFASSAPRPAFGARNNNSREPRFGAPRTGESRFDANRSNDSRSSSRAGDSSRAPQSEFGSKGGRQAKPTRMPKPARTFAATTAAAKAEAIKNGVSKPYVKRADRENIFGAPRPNSANANSNSSNSRGGLSAKANKSIQARAAGAQRPSDKKPVARRGERPWGMKTRKRA